MYRLASLFIGVWFVCGPASAQPAPQNVTPRVSAWIAAGTADVMSAPYEIRRFGGRGGEDVIVLRAGADAITLTAAVEALLLIRRQSGDSATSDAVLRVHRGAPSSLPVLPWADRVLRDLSAAEPRQISRIGRVKAVRIWLPAARRDGGIHEADQGIGLPRRR
jgi:hypothetical protein